MRSHEDGEVRGTPEVSHGGRRRVSWMFRWLIVCGIGVVLVAVMMQRWARRGSEGRPVVLVTGGAGFIGSHTVVSILTAIQDAEVLVLDDFRNAKRSVLRRMELAAGRRFYFREVDMTDYAAVRRAVRGFPIRASIHFAGLKSVGESTKTPLSYYHNNLVASVNVLRILEERGAKKLIFSSSATVYANVPGEEMPIKETAPTGTASPYGRTKLFAEEMMRDVASADKSWSIIALRYFNPVGAHQSGLIGEEPSSKPNNLMPLIAQVALGWYPQLEIFGDDYASPDGTCLRDYIHVMDLAEGHVHALRRLESDRGFRALNLGTGKPHSVKEMVAAFENISGIKIRTRIGPRRPGDLPVLYANASLAGSYLTWSPRRNLTDMVTDLWHFYQLHASTHPPQSI